VGDAPQGLAGMGVQYASTGGVVRMQEGQQVPNYVPSVIDRYQQRRTSNLAADDFERRVQEIYRQLPFRGTRNDSDRRAEARRLAEEELSFSSDRDAGAELDAYISGSRELDYAQRNPEVRELPMYEQQFTTDFSDRARGNPSEFQQSLIDATGTYDDLLEAQRQADIPMMADMSGAPGAGGALPPRPFSEEGDSNDGIIRQFAQGLLPQTEEEKTAQARRKAILDGEDPLRLEGLGSVSDLGPLFSGVPTYEELKTDLPEDATGGYTAGARLRDVVTAPFNIIGGFLTPEEGPTLSDLGPALGDFGRGMAGVGMGESDDSESTEENIILEDQQSPADALTETLENQKEGMSHEDYLALNAILDGGTSDADAEASSGDLLSETEVNELLGMNISSSADAERKIVDNVDMPLTNSFLTDLNRIGEEGADLAQTRGEQIQELIDNSRSQSKKDAFFAAITQLGAGIASGDMSAGIEAAQAEVSNRQKAQNEKELLLETQRMASEDKSLDRAAANIAAMANIDVKYRQLAQEVLKEEGLMSRDQTRRQVAVADIVSKIFDSAMYDTQAEASAAYASFYNTMARQFDIPVMRADSEEEASTAASPDINQLVSERYEL